MRRGRFFISDRFCPHLDEAGEDDRCCLMTSRAISAGRLTDELGKARAERAQRSTADSEARVGDRHVAAPEERFGPLDPAGHQIAIRALVERGLEAAGEVAGRHGGRPSKGRDVERLLEVAIHAVLCLAQPHEVAEMHESDRVLAKRIHGVVKASAPELTSTTWYGMPAYAKEGKIICFFQSAQKFKTRYATLGFNAPANLDEGAMWPVAFAVTKLTPADDARIAALVKKAIS